MGECWPNLYMRIRADGLLDKAYELASIVKRSEAAREAVVIAEDAKKTLEECLWEVDDILNLAKPKGKCKYTKV